MNNINRGEVNLVFTTQILTLRPSFQALYEIEFSCSKSILNMLLNFPQDQLKINEIIEIIRFGAKAYDGETLSTQKIEQLLNEKPIIEILPTLLKFLKNAIGIKEII